MHLRLRTKMETAYARIKAGGKVLITGNKEAYDTVLGFSWDFPEFYQGTVVWDNQSETICRVHQCSQRTTFVPDQDDVVPTACAWYTDMQCPLDQEAKFSYTAKWSSGILTCRVLSTRRRRAVRLPSGLRVLFSQLLFCLVSTSLSPRVL